MSKNPYNSFAAPRIPADPFARSADSSQRSLLVAQFSRSAVSAIPSKPGRAQGWAKGPKERAPGPHGEGQGAPSGPLGPGEGAFGALGAHGAVGIIPKLFRMEMLSGGVKRRQPGARVRAH